MKLWCTNQMVDKKRCVLCCVHLAEGRVFECPYENNVERLKSQYPCSDYKDVNIKKE